MEFVKRHLFYIICGAAGILGIALAITGMGAMPRVQAAMDSAAKLYRDLDPVQSSPVNRSMIENRREHVDRILKEHEFVRDQARKLYRCRPLVAGALPTGPADVRREFRKVYGEEMQKLWKSLRAGTTATEADVAAMRERILEETHRERLGQDQPDSAPAKSAAPASSTEGMPTKESIRKDPVVRAELASAQRIYCYGVHWEYARPPEKHASLLFAPRMKDTGLIEPPAEKDIWRAQLWYWIQKDVVEAIVSLNESAANQLREKNEDPWVGVLPVKDVISIRILDQFVQQSDEYFVGANPGGYDDALPPGTPNSVFTGSMSGENHEVVQFTVKLVMDQRSILQFVERLSSDGFHTLVRVGYKAVDPNLTLKGKIYGADPVVNVVMDFETVLLAEVFRRWMPQEICEEYEINCPKTDEAGTEADRNDSEGESGSDEG